jgi:Tfp pilus assembly protein PilV
MTAPTGSALVEVLVGLVLVALAAGVLAGVTMASGRALVAARRDATGTALAAARLEELHAGPSTSGSDTALHDAVTYARRWTAAGGRGRPASLDVVVAWPGHQVGLATEVAP